MNKKYTIDILQKLVGDKYIILDNSISSLKNGITAINQEGYKVILYRDNIINNNIPETFHKSNPYTIDNINNYLSKERNSEYYCVDTKYVGNDVDMKFIHTSCGTEFYATLIEMQGKWVISKKYKYYKQCPKCKQTRIESVHASVLKQVFMHEYPDTILEDKSCINPKTNKPLPTDIVNHRLKIAVEIQSSYHDEYSKKIIDKFKKDYWISLGYSFFDPDIRDYTIIELVNIFFDNIKTIPNYVDYNWSNITNFTKVQEFVDKGYTIKEISELMDIPRETISGLVRDKKVILPKGYYEKVKNIKPIIRLSTNNEFIARYPTLKSITNDNFATGTVERVLYKKQSFAYNSFWLYESDYLSGNYSIPKVKDDKYLQSVAKYDINNNFIHSYDSIYEAEKDSVSTRGEILRVANGNRKSSHKEKWKFIVTS